MKRDRHYPLRLPVKEAEAVDAVCEASRVSFNRVVSLCVQKGLPAVRELLSGAAARITNVDPLPDKVLVKLYTDREDEEASIRRLVDAQPKGGE
jgi:hypothetical protein